MRGEIRGSLVGSLRARKACEAGAFLGDSNDVTVNGGVSCENEAR